MSFYLERALHLFFPFGVFVPDMIFFCVAGQYYSYTYTIYFGPITVENNVLKMKFSCILRKKINPFQYIATFCYFAENA